MERHHMRKIREVLRLHFESHLTHRQISASTGVSKGTVSEYLRRARGDNLSWQEAQGMDDSQVEARLFSLLGRKEPPNRAAIDMPWVRWEMRRTGVTLMMLWSEYVQAVSRGAVLGAVPYGYSQFCDLYARYEGHVDVTMRQVHKAGEKVFVDYSGKKPCIYDQQTGEATECELFVGVLGASNFTFVEATRSQTKIDFCASTVRMFEFFGGTPRVMVPDQLRSAVSGPDRYDPAINPSYAELAQHYSVAVVPARPGEPRDKPKVENGVLIAQRWILACLRNRRFFSLQELNEAICELLQKMNNRPFQKLEGCRRSAFETIDLPAMKALPATRWQYADRKRARVNIDYHVAIDWRLYSVPYQLANQPVEVSFTQTVVEIFHQGKRVASHQRLWSAKGSASTQEEHRPKNHRDYGHWPPSRLIAWAMDKGADTGALVTHILTNRPHPESAYRACMALIRDAQSFPADRFNAACRRAMAIGSPNRYSVRSILKKGLEGAPLPEIYDPSPGPLHGNVRGATYYDRKESESNDRPRNDRETEPDATDHDGPGLPGSADTGPGQPDELHRTDGPDGRQGMDRAGEPPSGTPDPCCTIEHH
jgi:transposase